MGKLTYSMDGSRNGADGTADCSGSLTQALYEAGAWRCSLLYNTEMLHSYLLGNGYHLAYENNGYTSPVVGDIIIWGQRGRSAGGAGHTGVICGSGRNGTMVSTCYWTEGEKGQLFKTSLTSGTGVKIATHTIMYIADKGMKKRKKLVIL